MFSESNRFLTDQDRNEKQSVAALPHSVTPCIKCTVSHIHNTFLMLYC